MIIQSCVSPSGKFIYGIHKPFFKVKNKRESDLVQPLGTFEDGAEYNNMQNFPAGDIDEKNGDWIFEVPNPFPFRGATYICKSWADEKVDRSGDIALPDLPETSFARFIQELGPNNQASEKTQLDIYRKLPESLQLAVATTSTDPVDLQSLANLSCAFVFDPNTGLPAGLQYRKDRFGRTRPVIHNLPLFEVLGNNINLPDAYKEVMVLRPGVQGGSEIVGEWLDAANKSHVFEYLRRNSYIPWGHYAANMANDAVRYRTQSLSQQDIRGLRHLYYQRTYIRMAEQLGLSIAANRKSLTVDELENLRLDIAAKMKKTGGHKNHFASTLWGWNYGYDFSPSHCRLHASHQQIHQQYALLPGEVEAWHDFKNQAAPITSYNCGNLIAEFIEQYKKSTSKNFFDTYIKAIRNNRRMDDKTDHESSLIIFEDENIMLFIPKAQTSQWEIQLMTIKKVGNVLEADTATRKSIDLGLLLAQKILARLGARMVTTIEFPKSFFSANHDQRLLYALIPKLPYSMGAFSEAQLRFICGHYPEDFAAACRLKILEI